jgi:hypothetical protein
MLSNRKWLPSLAWADCIVRLFSSTEKEVSCPSLVMIIAPKKACFSQNVGEAVMMLIHMDGAEATFGLPTKLSGSERLSSSRIIVRWSDSLSSCYSNPSSRIVDVRRRCMQRFVVWISFQWIGWHTTNQLEFRSVVADQSDSLTFELMLPHLKPPCSMASSLHFGSWL